MIEKLILEQEYHAGIVLGLIFTCMAMFSGYRLYYHYYFSYSAGGKVIALFNSFILFTSVLRSIWLFLPQTSFEALFTRAPLNILSTTQSAVHRGFINIPPGQTFLLSETLLSLGTITFFANFILLALYWRRMLHKLTSMTSNKFVPVPATSMEKMGDTQSIWTTTINRMKNYGTLEMFYLLVLLLVVGQLSNGLLYFSGLLDSYQMILLDTLAFTSLALLLLIVLSILSHRLRLVLTLSGAGYHTPQLAVQIRRLSILSSSANVFFVFRVASETALSIVLMYLIREGQPYTDLLVDIYWGWFTTLRFSSEIVILCILLLVSSPARTHIARRMVDHSRIRFAMKPSLSQASMSVTERTPLNNCSL